MTATLDLKTTADTTIDGGGKITLDGGNQVRILRFSDGNYRTSKVTVTLQRLRLVNGKSTGTQIPAAPAPSQAPAKPGPLGQHINIVV